MKTRIAIAFTSAACGLTLMLWTAASAASAGEDGKATYVGSAKCKKCHMATHKDWKKTKMGLALDTLKPGAASEAKSTHNLDPSKDYTTDEKCLKCHTTGYGEEGGYSIPAADDKKAIRAAKKLSGVGCESCHGPGSEYIKFHDTIMKGKKEGKKYTSEEMYEAGMQKVEASTCTKCHNGDSPTFDTSAPFDFEKQKDEGMHKHIEMKQKTG